MSKPGNASELLPCPFCGEKDVGFGRTGQKWQTVACNECGAEGPCTEIDRDLIIKKWNTRPTPSDGAREALAQIDALISNGDRPTVNERNAFEHFTALNRLLMQIRDIARAPHPNCGVQTEQEPVWWRWRFLSQANGWSKWIALNNDEVGPFRELQGEGMEAGRIELEPLYAAPSLSSAQSRTGEPVYCTTDGADFCNAVSDKARCSPCPAFSSTERL